MERTVLFIGYDSPVAQEIGDYIRDIASAAYFANTHDQAIQVLNENFINSVVINLRNMTDAVIMRYINKYYPEINVVISASREFDEIISIFNQQNFSLLQQPLKLEELKGVI